jgi:hypothetical protein
MRLDRKRLAWYRNDMLAVTRVKAWPARVTKPWHPAQRVAALLLSACSSNTTVIEHREPVDAGMDPMTPGAVTAAPVPTQSPEALLLDVYGAIGNRYWISASDEQVERINADFYKGPLDRYTPFPPSAEPPSVEHLFVTTAGDEPATADFGKIQVHLVGSTTGRAWTSDSLPNFKLDVDEFIDGNRIGGEEHLRLNNALVGTIFREKLVYDIFNRLGYPAPRASFAWVSGSVWGPGVAVPYVVVESYKRQFCERRVEQLGGGCPNMWEFSFGDVGYGLLELPENCQLRECDSRRATEFEAMVVGTAPGAGFKDALIDWVDWDAFHRYQCLSWMLELFDDTVHSWFNTVLVERADGRFQFLPFSVDVSFTSEYGPVTLAGVSSLASGCQSDTQCWADTIATCDALLDELVALSPVTMLDEMHAALQDAGMLRPGDGESYESLRSHMQSRLEQLPAELQHNRLAPVTSTCLPPLTQCAEYCVLPERCDELFPREQPLSDAGSAADAGAPDAAAAPIGP